MASNLFWLSLMFHIRARSEQRSLYTIQEILQWQFNQRKNKNKTRIQKEKFFKTSKEKFFKTSFLLLILASKESLSSIVLFQRSALFFLIFINLFIYIFHFPSYQLQQIKNHQSNMFQLQRFSFHGKNLCK